MSTQRAESQHVAWSIRAHEEQEEMGTIPTHLVLEPYRDESVKCLTSRHDLELDTRPQPSVRRQGQADDAE